MTYKQLDHKYLGMLIQDVEVYKWWLDDCQDDELLLRDPTRSSTYSAAHWVEYSLMYVCAIYW